MGAKRRLAMGIAAGACIGAAPAPTPAPKPASLETYKDWTIGCDNRNRCEAVSLLPDGGDWPDDPVMVGIARDAGADADTQVWVSRHDSDRSDVGFWVDGRKIASAIFAKGEAKVDGPQAAALAIAMARGSTLEIRSGSKLPGRPSLAGSGAALRYMDAKQGRAGTMTALVATGPLGRTAVRPPPLPPIIKRAPVPIGLPAPVALWRTELANVGKLTGCTDEMKDAQPPAPAQHRLSKTETLVLIPCGSGAYNFTSVPVIATGTAGNRAFRFATFDYQPGWSEDPKHPELVNVAWVPEKSRLESFAKGRGLGDCGGSEDYVWDGVRFRLVEATAMGECRGAWHWITTWTARVMD